MTTKKPKLFVIQSFRNESKAVFGLVSSAAANAGVSAYRADSIEAGESILKGIHEAITEADVLIADVTNSNPNVMYEVGIAHAADKPLILVADNSRHVPFDLASVRVLIYDLLTPLDFVERLSRELQQALKTPKAFSLTQSAASQEARQRVFISYSHRDKAYLDRLLVHLKPLEREGIIDLWVDTRLHAGDRWKKEIEKALQKATAAILLVSSDFLASDFITDNELPPLLRGAEDKGTRIIPVIVKPCRFARDKNLRHFQAINDPKDALMLLSEGEQETYYDKIAEDG